MEAATTKKEIKRQITVGGKTYEMPGRMSTLAYLHYLEVRDAVMDTEASRRLYTRQQFFDMMDVIIEMYGNKFTKEDMLDAESGLTPEEIITEFALMDVSVGRNVDRKVEDFKENFTAGE